MRRLWHCQLFLYLIGAGLACLPAGATECLNADCQSPFISQVAAASTQSLMISWQDPFFQLGKQYEIEIVPYDSTPTGTPTASMVSGTQHLIDGLSAGTAYHVYIRANCGGELSPWNGPADGATMIDNDGACLLSLPLDDNNCPDVQEYLVDVVADSQLLLGDGGFIMSVELIVEHPWLADLSLSLVSPSGQAVLLSSDNGVGAQDLGLPSDSTCTFTASFSDFACISIQDVQTMFTGSFLPEEPLGMLYDSSLASGIWKLQICDKASDDVGILKHLRINLASSSCALPPTLQLIEEGDDEAAFALFNAQECDSVILAFGPDTLSSPQNAVDSLVVGCGDSVVLLEQLQIATSYTLFARRRCGPILSQWSCPITFTTACAEITLASDFNTEQDCDGVCAGSCPLMDTTWKNLTTDEREWNVSGEATSTDFTGPAGPRLDVGKYLYSESSGENCVTGSEAVIESTCLYLSESSGGCDFSFWYHLFGAQSGTLRVDVSADGGIAWTTVWSVSGDQGDRWQYVQVDLSDYEQMFFRVRIVSVRGAGFLSDAAIDDLTFHGAVIADPASIQFFVDQDGDSYGSIDSSRCICVLQAPQGFSRDSTDCNDQDSLVHPGMTELPCNLIDDNCNGGIDEGQDPSPIEYTVEVLQDASCTGINDGAIRILPTEGTAPFQFDWGIGVDSNEINDLSPGTYQCTISDDNGCNAITEAFQIGITEQLYYQVVSITDPDCPGAGNGAITGLMTGGLGPFAYLWSNGDTTLDLTNVDVGQYQLTITDANGCYTVSSPLHVTASAPFPVALIERSDVSCHGGIDGAIQLIAPGASAPVSFNWSTGDTTSRLEDLAAGSYSCTVTDAQGCFVTLENIPVGQPSELEVHIDAQEPPTCHDGNDGTIQITASGGSPPYFYQWNNQVFSDDLHDATAGIYTVTVTDINGCMAVMEPLALIPPPAIIVSVAAIKDAECPADSSGSIALNVEGGMPPYSFDWSTGATDSITINGVGTGTYAVTVADAFGCKGILRDIPVVSQNLPLELSISDTREISCFGDSVGVLEVSVFNGLAPYRFNWSIGEEHISLTGIDSISGLPAGMYAVTITDHRGCTGVLPAYPFDQPPRLQFQLDSIQDVICFGSKTGSIVISHDGGTPPLAFLWSNGDTLEHLLNVSAGLYDLTLTDALGCQLVTPRLLVDDVSDSVALAFETMAATGGSPGWAEVFISGGYPPFTYLWDAATGYQTTARASMLEAGTYTVSITDAEQCQYVDSVVVNTSTSIAHFVYSQLRISPNPNRGTFFIEIARPWQHGVLYNVQGRVIPTHFRRINDTVWACTLDHPVPGIYFLRIDGRITTKVVIAGF